MYSPGVYIHPMQVYIHTFIATREAFNLSPLQPTEPIHVRLFFSPHHISKKDYCKYLGWINSADQCTEFHTMGAAPATLTKASLLPPNAFATQVGVVKYDFMLEAQEDYLAYLEFVRQTLQVEAQRPVFRPFLKSEETKIPTDEWPTLAELAVTSKLVPEREDIPYKDSELPTFLLLHPPEPSGGHAAYTLWLYALKQYADRAIFYRQEDAKATEPQLLAPMASHCWLICTKVSQIHDHVNKHKKSLYKTSSGHIVTEKLYDRVWGNVLGTEAMPQVTVELELSLQGPFLMKKQGAFVLETRLTEAQVAIVKPFFTKKELRPFNLPALYDLFAMPAFAKPFNAPTIRSTQLIGVNTVGAAIRAANDAGSNTTASNASNASTFRKETPAPEGTDAYACGWETIVSAPQKTAEPETLREQLSVLLKEFKESHAPLPAPPSLNVSPTLFQHGFLLYLLHKQQAVRSSSTINYGPIIEYYKKSKLDLQGFAFTAVNITVLWPLLAYNTDFLREVHCPEGLTLLEARVLLSLYQYPLEYRNPQQQVQLFHLVVRQFAEGIKVAEDGRVAAKALWEAFLAFLRKHRLDYVGFFGTQQEFNEILKELGWEQKRVAAGKIWLKMELSA